MHRPLARSFSHSRSFVWVVVDFVCVATVVSSSIDIKTHVIQSARTSAFDTKEEKKKHFAKAVGKCQ